MAKIPTALRSFARYFWAWHLKPFLIGIDVAAAGTYSLFRGGPPYWTISCRCGVAMGTPGSLASKIPWPQWWINHCMKDSVFMTLV